MTDYINYRDAQMPKMKPKEKQVDIALSKAVGKEILMGTNDHRRVTHLFAKWGANRDENDFRSIDYTKDKEKLKQLKEAVGIRA